MTITEFLLARIEEDEAAAQQTLVGPHKTAAPWVGVFRVVEDFDGGTAAEATSHWLAAHIARHDPARVLAECKAKRAIVAEHKGEKWTIPSTPSEFEYWHSTDLMSVEVRHDGRHVRTITYAEYLKEVGAVKQPPPVELRALATVYVDHVDYLEEWAL